jgi:hypothetical protein
MLNEFVFGPIEIGDVGKVPSCVPPYSIDMVAGSMLPEKPCVSTPVKLPLAASCTV